MTNIYLPTATLNYISGRKKKIIIIKGKGKRKRNKRIFNAIQWASHLWPFMSIFIILAIVSPIETAKNIMELRIE